ncbi:MAG: Pr6Pr family membrane protein [Ornithinimicrobium sp.]
MTDPILHYVTPAATGLVWLVLGPRGWITWRTVLASMILPLIWIAWMLSRGAVVGAYPYGFADVGTRGFGAVAVTLGLIVVFGPIVASIYWLIDRALLRVMPAAEGANTRNVGHL